MTDEEIKKTAELLSSLEPGFLPYTIFLQVARLVVLPIVEFIPLRLNNNKMEVLLIARDQDDPFWPGMLHTPGTVIRSSDEVFENSNNVSAYKRIIEEELKSTRVSEPHYVGSIFHRSKRGTEQAQLYWVEVIGENIVGEYYPVDELPDNLISDQIDFIKQSSEAFKKEKASTTT
jgi:hypothetical protein